MDIKKILAFAVLGVFAIFAYSANREKAADQHKVAQEYGLTEAEIAAYKDCNSHMSGKRIGSSNPFSKTTGGSVPPEICACQSKSMVKVMKPGGLTESYSSHQNVVEFITEKKPTKKKSSLSGKEELAESQLQKGATKKGGFAILVASLHKCMGDYARQQHAIQQKKIKELCASGEVEGRICKS